MQFVELAIVARLWRRGRDFIKQALRTALDIVCELGLAELGEVMVFDIHPVHEGGAGAREHVARVAVALGQLQDPQRLVHMLCGLDADVVAMQRLANRSAEAVNAGQGVQSEPDHQHHEQQADVADPRAQRGRAHDSLSASSALSPPTTSTSKSVAAVSNRLVTSPLSRRRHNG